jgi:mannose-6-phosphate isomerase-like protein (cupin superfamily)
MKGKSSYAAVPAYRTKDGSEIRELMHPDHHRNARQSLAEAIIHPGETTLLHKHLRTEELYHVTAGQGLMTLGEQRFEVIAGDTICISPGTPHCVSNTGQAPLRILCCCSPAYSHDDTILLTGDSGTAMA